jgi:hypothetical protein
MSEKITFNLSKDNIHKAEELIELYKYHIKKASSLADELAALNINLAQTNVR